MILLLSFSKEKTNINGKFVWLERDHPYLVELRERYNLLDLIAGVTDDVEKVKRIME